MGNLGEREATDFGTVVDAALQTSPGFEGVSDGCFQCQQHRLVESFRPHRIREYGQSARLRDLGPSLRQACRCVRALGFRAGLLQGDGHLSLALVSRLAGVVGPQRQPAGGDGEHSRNDGRDEEAESKLPLPLGRSFSVSFACLGGFTEATLVLHFILLALALGLLAGGQERPLDRIEFVAVRRNPFPTDGQARPRVQEILLGFGRGIRPLLRDLGQPALDTQARTLGFDPPAELRPAPDQSLVSDFDGAVGRVGPLGRDQAGVTVGQDADHLPHRRRPFRVVGQELAIRNPALRVLGPFSRLHQPQEDPPAELLLLGLEPLEDLVGPVLQRPFDPAQGFVRPQRQPPDVPLLPDLRQRELQERQGPRLPFDISQQPLR